VIWPSPPRVGRDARITVPLPRRDGVVLVPIRAVQSDGRRYVVEIIDGAALTPVEIATALPTETEVEIRSGLQEGQRVRIGPERTTTARLYWHRRGVRTRHVAANRERQITPEV
jgi:multidrug efflux pump subunit AcrA (membrane-fusion protein)